jgi:hypothetical protein
MKTVRFLGGDGVAARSAAARGHGCSAPCSSRRFGDAIDVESGPSLGISDVVASCGPDRIVSGGAPARDDVGVLADAGSVRGDGAFAHAATAVLSAPKRAHPCVRVNRFRVEAIKRRCLAAN